MKKEYESPELDIRWFEMQDVISLSGDFDADNSGNGVVEDGTEGGW